MSLAVFLLTNLCPGPSVFRGSAAWRGGAVEWKCAPIAGMAARSSTFLTYWRSEDHEQESDVGCWGLLIAGLAAQAAEAKRWGCWIQADRNVRIRNTASNATAAVNDWNNLTILNLSSVGSGEETYVFNANSGNTGWGGLASITNYSGCTILRATAQLNTYYSWTANAARGVHCQEVGHTFGLDHSNDGGCMGGGYWYDIGTHYHDRPGEHQRDRLDVRQPDRRRRLQTTRSSDPRRARPASTLTGSTTPTPSARPPASPPRSSSRR